MTTTTDSAHYPGLLPVEPPHEPPPIHPTTLENDLFPNGQASHRKQTARTISRFLITFCSGVVGTLAWQWYADAAREMIAQSIPQLDWLAPPRLLSTAPNALGMSCLAAPATPFDQQQLNGSLDAMRQSIEGLVAGHELILRSIDQIATRVTVDHEHLTQNTDPTATNVPAGQKQIADSIDQAGTNGDQALPAKANGPVVESGTDGASLQPTVRLDIKPTEARPPRPLSERRKEFSAASARHDASCLPSASAVRQNHPGGWPSWTLRAPGHEGTQCWYAAARPRESDHRKETTPGNEMGTTENRLFTPAAPRGRAEGWDAGLP
jgi:hypothetical protein